MKCIKMHGQMNELKRVTDKKACELVDYKKAVYIPKCEYKAVHGKGASSSEKNEGSKSSQKKAKSKNKQAI